MPCLGLMTYIQVRVEVQTKSFRVLQVSFIPLKNEEDGEL